MKIRERERESERKSGGCIILLNQNPYWNAFEIFLINLLSFFRMLILQLLKSRSNLYILGLLTYNLGIYCQKMDIQTDSGIHHLIYLSDRVCRIFQNVKCYPIYRFPLEVYDY